MTIGLLAAVFALMIAFIILSRHRFIANMVLNCAIGICSLFAGNYLLSGFGISVGINLFTCLFAGILGIPGTVGLFIIRFMM